MKVDKTYWGIWLLLLVSVTISFGQTSLQIQRPQQDSIVISWPTPAPGMMLQQTLSSELPGTWNNVPQVPTIQSDRNQLTLPVTGTTRFFRLTRPCYGNTNAVDGIDDF